MNSQTVNRWVGLGVVVCIALAIGQTSSSQEPAFGLDPYAADEFKAATDQANRARKEAEAARREAEKQMHEARKQAELARKEAAKQWQIQNDKFKFVFSPFGQEGHSDLRKAAEAVRDAEDDGQREEAEAKLRQVLEDSFDADMKRREKSLEEMENRLEKLQNQLERRREKMEEIVELQMRVLVNEADGLGFFSGGQQSYEVPMGEIGNDPFAGRPRIEYRPTPVRITAPRTELVVEAPTAAPAPTAPGVPPAPPVPEDESAREPERR